MTRIKKRRVKCFLFLIEKHLYARKENVEANPGQASRHGRKMRINLQNMRVPTGTHEAELLDVSLFTTNDCMQFLKMRFEVYGKNRNFRMDKNYPDPANNLYFQELIESLEIPLKRGSILETEDMKDFAYVVTISEDEKGRRYIRNVAPAYDEEEEEENFDYEEDENVDFCAESADAEEDDFCAESADEEWEPYDFRGESEEDEIDFEESRQ